MTSTTELDLDYLTTLSHTSINQPSTLHQIFPHLDGNASPNDMLQLLHQFTQKMEYLIMRDSGAVRPVARHQTPNLQAPVTAERIVPVLQLLDTARIVVDTALGLPSLQSHNQIQERSASVSLGARADEWDVFGQWLKWHMLHPEPTRSHLPVQPLREASIKLSPPTSPGAIQVPRQQLTGQSRADISPLGSPLPESVFTPGVDAFSTPGTVFTSTSSERRFSSIDLGTSYAEENTQLTPATWPVTIVLENKRTFDAFLEILISPSRVVEKLRSRTRDQKTIYHVPHGGTNRAHAFVPWIDNSRVHKSSLVEARLQFKGLHQVIVKDERAHRNTIYNTRPVYRFDDPEGGRKPDSDVLCRSIEGLTIHSDLRQVQEQLLGKSVVATFDVVRISTRAGQDHCASETLRVLEDAERHRSLLYYAHRMSSKSATHSPGFVEWSCISTILQGSLTVLTVLSK